jgi:hypothetical protein
MGDSEEEVIRRDKEEYPHCHHSTSIQQFFSFSSNSGQTNDSVKTILRVCPGEKPVPIFKKSDKNVSESNEMTDIFGSGSGESLAPFGGNESFDSLLNSFFGDSFFGHGGQGENSGKPSFFGFGDPFGGFFGHQRGFGDIHRHPSPRQTIRGGGREGVRGPHENDWLDSVPSEFQPPHALPKGTSPSNHPSNHPFGENGRRGPKGEVISPPENI